MTGEKEVLDVLAKAANVYNTWSILQEAIDCGDDDGFTTDYINCERNRLTSDVGACINALNALSSAMGAADE